MHAFELQGRQDVYGLCSIISTVEYHFMLHCTFSAQVICQGRLSLYINPVRRPTSILQNLPEGYFGPFTLLLDSPSPPTRFRLRGLAGLWH